MIIDDDLDTLPLYEMIGDIPDTLLTMQTGGLVALNTLNQLNYDVDAVVLDLCMPDRDGLSITQDIRREENIRSKDNPIEIFWLTGVDVENDPVLTEAKTAFGVRRVFTKPIDANAVVTEVRHCLSCLRAERC